MSITARIKQKSLFKKKMNLEDIIKFTGLSYGVSDENYRLDRDEIGEHTLIYDEAKLARGFELWLEGSDVLLSLSLPTAPSEIRLFYSLVEKLCIEFNTKKYLREDEEEAFLSKFDDIIELFYQAAEEQVLEEKNIVDYHNISLTQNELIELNNTIKYKIEEIIHKRKSEDEELQYDIVMVSIPVQKKETCNLW